MAQPFGRWLVAAVFVVIRVAVIFGVLTVQTSLERNFDPAARTAAVRNLCRAGMFACTAVFLIIGEFLILAAWHADPSEAQGLAGALDALRAGPTYRHRNLALGSHSRQPTGPTQPRSPAVARERLNASSWARSGR